MPGGFIFPAPDVGHAANFAAERWVKKKPTSQGSVPWTQSRLANRYLVTRGFSVCYYDRPPTGDQAGSVKPRGGFDLRRVKHLRAARSTDPSAPSTAISVEAGNAGHRTTFLSATTHHVVFDFGTREECDAWLRIWVNAVPQGALAPGWEDGLRATCDRRRSQLLELEGATELSTHDVGGASDGEGASPGPSPGPSPRSDDLSSLAGLGPLKTEHGDQIDFARRSQLPTLPTSSTSSEVGPLMAHVGSFSVAARAVGEVVGGAAARATKRPEAASAAVPAAAAGAKGSGSSLPRSAAVMPSDSPRALPSVSIVSEEDEAEVLLEAVMEKQAVSATVLRPWRLRQLVVRKGGARLPTRSSGCFHPSPRVRIPHSPPPCPNVQWQG